MSKDWNEPANNIPALSIRSNTALLLNIFSQVYTQKCSQFPSPHPVCQLVFGRKSFRKYIQRVRLHYGRRSVYLCSRVCRCLSLPFAEQRIIGGGWCVNKSAAMIKRCCFHGENGAVFTEHARWAQSRAKHTQRRKLFTGGQEVFHTTFLVHKLCDYFRDLTRKRHLQSHPHNALRLRQNTIAAYLRHFFFFFFFFFLLRITFPSRCTLCVLHYACSAL